MSVHVLLLALVFVTATREVATKNKNDYYHLEELDTEYNNSASVVDRVTDENDGLPLECREGMWN
jgi:hypothetical protein